MSDQDTGGFESPARSGPRRFPEFDGLRALAAMAVLVTHAGFLTGASQGDAGRYLARGEVGVPIFFVISGFLLYRPFAVAHFEGRRSTAPPSFWRRRVTRIFPAYWVALTFVPVLTGDALVHDVADVVAYYGLLQIYDADRVLGGLPQAWSLCTELGFYLLLPVAATLVATRPRALRPQLRAEVALVVALYVASVAFRVVLVVIDHDGPQFTWTFAWLDVFALGMALAVASAWAAATGVVPRPLAWVARHPEACWLGSLAAFVGLANLGLPHEIGPIDDGDRFAGQLLASAVAVGLVAPAVFWPTGPGRVRALLRSRVTVTVGLVSYSIYLWHLDVLEEAVGWTGGRVFDASFPAVVVVGLVVTLAIAAVSYVVIERPASAAGEPQRQANG